MSTFKPVYIAERAQEFTVMIRECEDSGFPKHLLYRSLGMCLVMADPPEEQKLPLLNEVWKVIMKLKNPGDYITCSEVWIEYVVKNFSKREVNTILGDIVKHMLPDRAFEDHYPQLQSIMSKIMSHMHDFSVLFALEKLLPFIDMFQRDTVKVEVCKIVMDAFARYQVEPTNDPVIINAVMYICKILHDSVNALTLEDEIRQIGQLIIGFIRNISFGRDFEQQLSFYVESRACFSNIDAVLIHLIQSVNNLTMLTRQVVKGNHTRKTASFVRACVAYTFISIPSLNNVFARLNLYLHSGRVALLNQCLSQGDAFFKAAISILPDVPRTMNIEGKVRTTEPLLIEFLSNFTSTLLIVPDNPEQGVLYLLRGLLNVLQEYTWDGHTDGKATAYISVLSMLSATWQENFIYHIDKVDSNDTLYGYDPKFLNELKQITSTLVTEILNHLKALDKSECLKRQSSLAFDLFNHLVVHGDMSQEQVLSMAINLWTLANKHGNIDTKISARTIQYIKERSLKTEENGWTELSSKLMMQSRT